MPYNRGENGKEWATDDKPMPGYGDLRAYAPFADIDLTDDVKARRPDGDIPRDAIERALGRYLDAFADLAGDRDHVFALDSVGGAYAFVAPTATAPIADALDAGERAVIFGDMMDRLNEWLAGVHDDVHAAEPAIEGVLKTDLLNNKNRLYKAPLSVHSSLDGLVTPLAPADPEYVLTPLDAADDDLLAEAEAWAEAFAADHREAVESVVATLWPDEFAEADGWEYAVRARVADLTAERERHRVREADRRAAAANVPDGLEETDDFDVLLAATERIDVQDVAQHLAAEWDTAPGRDPPAVRAPVADDGQRHVVLRGFG